MYQNAIPEVISQKDAKRNSVPELFFFSGIGISNTLSGQILCHCAFWNLFFILEKQQYVRQSIHMSKM
jgi:hypothetical protein